MMKNNLLLSFLILGCLSCSSPEKEQEEQQASTDSVSLTGSWKLTSYFDNEDSTWKEYPDHIIYEKHITPTHFTWVQFDTEANQLLGAGGGTYTASNGSYTENIQFFFPPGSNELGQSIPFTVGMEDGKWHHKGYSKIMEFDPEKGEMVAVDSSKIEEYWVKTDEDPSQNGQLTGTWQLLSYKNDQDSIWSEYPGFIKYEKHITPSHFTWIKYNSDGDELMAIGGGTYEVTDSNYVEKVDFHYPEDSEILGQTIQFKRDMEEEEWHHTGFYQESEDSVKIEEIWIRYNNNKVEDQTSMLKKENGNNSK